jgi:diguanylate cyclase (GGDEF)-like protein
MVGRSSRLRLAVRLVASWQVLVAAAAALVVGGFLAVHALQAKIEDRALHSTELSIRLIMALVVERNMTMADLKRGWFPEESIKDMDADIGELRDRGDVAGLDVWNASNGHLVYISAGGPLADPLSREELQSVRRGEVVIEHGTADEKRAHTLDVALPYDVDHDGRIEAVVEVELPQDPIDASISQDSRMLYLGAGVVALIGAALLVATLRRQRAHKYAARHDALTGLGNRTLLNYRGTMALSRSPRLALFLLDLDGFKEINDTLGHQAGDDLLVAVAAALRQGARPADTVIRLGGDEFAVLLPDLPTPEAATGAAYRLLESLREPVVISGVAVEIEASLGIALAPAHGTDLPTLLRCADVAMYEAKRGGRIVTVYDPETDARETRQLTVLAELRRAIAEGQLRLFYQPKSTAAGEVHDVEALVRWQHPERGLLGPGEFLPLAEHTSLIRPLTEWVLREAARQCAAWRQAGYDLRIACNVSPRNLIDEDIPGAVAAAAGAAGIPLASLQIEITETAVMADPVRAIAVLADLHDMGVAVWIDDFGVGYTSLSYLTSIKAAGIKIDRQFVSRLLDNTNDEALVRNIIQLASDLGMTSLAEGVETAETWQCLTAVGCEEIQGYLLTRPLPPDAFLTWLDDWRAAHPQESRAAAVIG